MELKPLVPFEPVSHSSVPLGPQWIYQVKWDGVRMLVYHDGRETRLYNRQCHDRTKQYPELQQVSSYCTANSVILDGEIVALGADGKPSFHEVMRRDGIRRLERVETARNEVSVTYMIFDILYYNGEWVNQRTLQQRLNLLTEVVKPNKHVQLVSLQQNGKALLNAIRQQAMEGIVCKDLNSTYTIDGKDDRWRKVKNYGDLHAVIGGFTLNGGIVNAVLLGLYDKEGKLWYIGHTGTGKLTKADWRHLTQILQPLAVKDRPFFNQPERHKEAIWVIPQMVVKVKYTEWRWKEGRSLRQPSIQAFVDVPVEECRWPGG